MIIVNDLKMEYWMHENKMPQGISCHIKRGEVVAITGPNGSGKTTFARYLAGLIAPRPGIVTVHGADAGKEENLHEIRKRTGFVFQNPENQLIMDTVEEDIAFGPENMCLEQGEIEKRVIDAIEIVSGLNAGNVHKHREKQNEYSSYAVSENGTIENDESFDKSAGSIFAKRRIVTLSGGEKQRVAIAGVLAMHPELIIMDEPFSMLDKESRADILNIILEENRKNKVTVLMITHRPEEMLAADRLFVMKAGEIEKVLDKKTGEIRKYAESIIEKITNCSLNTTYENKIADKNVKADNIEITSKNGRADNIKTTSKNEREIDTKLTHNSKMVSEEGKDGKKNQGIIFDEVNFSYGKKKVFEKLTASIKKGETVIVTGKSGAGKTTLTELICGMMKPDTGKILIDGVSAEKVKAGKMGYVRQFAENQLFAETVYEDVTFGPRNMGLSKDELNRRCDYAIELAGLEKNILDRKINQLSAGEGRRVALAGVLAMKPEYLILDEPTAGLDVDGIIGLRCMISDLRRKGVTVIIVTHDEENFTGLYDVKIQLPSGIARLRTSYCKNGF